MSSPVAVISSEKDLTNILAPRKGATGSSLMIIAVILILVCFTRNQVSQLDHIAAE